MITGAVETRMLTLEDCVRVRAVFSARKYRVLENSDISRNPISSFQWKYHLGHMHHRTAYAPINRMNIVWIGV